MTQIPEAKKGKKNKFDYIKIKISTQQKVMYTMSKTNWGKGIYNSYHRFIN